jgi:hypothetical protein
MTMYPIRSAGLAVLVLTCGTWAGVPDPQIMTDHPVYRGELSCSTLVRNIGDAYRVFRQRYGHAPRTDTEKLLALWAWKSEHSMHACDNKVYVGPANPDARAGKDPPWLGSDGWMDNKDCQMNQFSFSFGLCYSIHAQMAVLVGRALGDMRRVRCPEITGHTPFEAYVDGRWVLADFTTGLMVFGDDGKPVGLREIYARKDAADKDWFTSPRRGGPYRFHMSPFGDRLDGYSPVRWQQPLFGYNAMPIVYTLRAGETFTRYLDPGLEDGKTWVFWGRDYYNIMGKPRHGPYRNVTFLDDPPIGNSRRGRGKAYYGNGVFEYAPPLEREKWAEGVCESREVDCKDGALQATAPGAYVVFEHVSPYVIAARPVKGGDREWNLLKEKCCDGAAVSGQAVDGGQSWQDAGVADRRFRIDFTDLVKGHHAYLLRLELPDKGSLKALNMRTVTQAGRGVFPRLTDGGTTITYHASGQSAIHGGPSQQLAGRFRRKDLESDGRQVYEIRAPGPIRHASGAARVNGAKGTAWSVDFSLDGGKTWQAGAKDLHFQTTGDGKLWENGRAAYVWAQMDFPRNDSRTVLIRFGPATILHAQVFVTYAARNASSLTVTYGWTEKGQPKQSEHTIPAGRQDDRWRVPTGEDVKTRWARFAAD